MIIKTGQYEVIESGIVQILKTEDTTMDFGGVSIVFCFEDSEKENTGIKLVVDKDKKILKFILVNINRQSYGTTEFVNIGSNDAGEDLYISFRATSLDDKRIWSLEYSIFKK